MNKHIKKMEEARRLAEKLASQTREEEGDSWENDVANLNQDDMAGWEDWCPDCLMHRDLCTCNDCIEREDDD